MARTKEGAALTEQHRQVQIQISRFALRGFIQLWPLWQGDARTFRALISASLPLIEKYHSTSSAAAAAYYESFRTAEKVGGDATPRLASLSTDDVIAGMYATGEKMTAQAIAAGQSADAAMQTALTRVSGSVTRQVLNGGRHTIVLSTAADKQAGGYARVTSPKCCAFCAMLAGRGPVFSENTADFEAHDHCACCGEPAYRDSEWPGRADEFRDMYNRAVDEANKAGDLRRGTSNDLLNAFRRVYDAAGETVAPGG